MSPRPPLLVIREGQAFWVEEKSISECAATLQAFHEGCFRHAYCYDATGHLWPIVDAALKERPSIIQRLLPWRQVAVELYVGAPSLVSVEDMIAKLIAVLQSDSEFNDYVAVPVNEMLERLENARTPSDLIRIVRGIGSTNIQ